MGIEPTPSAWKAEVLPLNYTRKYSYQLSVISWRGKDSNLRRHSRQIYSLLHLTALEPLPDKISRLFCVNHRVMSTEIKGYRGYFLDTDYVTWFPTTNRLQMMRRSF